MSDDYYDQGYAEQLERERDYDYEVAVAQAMNDAERDDEEHARRQRW